jgi:hypothetical protein
MPSDLIPIDNSAYHSIVPVKFTLSKQSSHENPILPGGKSAMIGAIPVQGTGRQIGLLSKIVRPVPCIADKKDRQCIGNKLVQPQFYC